MKKILWLPIVAFSVSFTSLRAQEAPLALELPKTDAGLPGAGPIRRAEWFTTLWKKRRAEFAAHAAKEAGAVVFLGDSITQGWGDLAQAFPGLKVANRGISGDTTRGMLVRLVEDVVNLKPQAVVILAGTNDLEEKATPEVIAENVRLIVAALKAHRADMPVVLCKVFPSSASKSRPAGEIQAVNKLYQALAKNEPQVTLLETWKVFANATQDAKPEEFPDLLHPNAAGYKKWAASLRPIFATLGLTETEVPPFSLEEGFESLFNGKDLTGWQFKGGPAFDGKSLSSDGRYLAKNGRLVVQTPSEGSKLAQLYTVRQFAKDFTLRLQFRATPDADSGVFIREPQLQCRDYVLAGPWKDLPNYRPQDWNDLEVVVAGTQATCTCNGDLIPNPFKNPLPATGPIGLEGDRGQMEYRRIRIQER